MATTRKRYMISVSNRMKKEIDKFKEEGGFATESSAIQELITLGLRRLEIEELKEREEKGK